MEETEARPKPMVEIGGKPILWHIMKIYETYGFNDFCTCFRIQTQSIKVFFKLLFVQFRCNYKLENKVDVHFSNSESFSKVTLVDTGLMTNTAGRIKKDSI
jgi:glucose-1-phosphate cytidylyltransferase